MREYALPAYLSDGLPPPPPPPPGVPPGAVAPGYLTKTFDSTFSASEVDLARSHANTFKWFPWDFFGSHASATKITLNADGSTTLQGDTTGPNGQITSMAPTSTGLVGTAFGGGGYFEATFSFNPQNVIKKKFVGWPSFWAMASEHMGGVAQWPGQVSGYEHFAEVDFFEYDISGSTDSYGATIHDWYGKWTPTTPFNDVTLPFSTVKRTPSPAPNYNSDHRYGCLWVPATASTQGQLKFFLDDVQIGPTTTWSLLPAGAVPPPSGQPWLFSVVDQQHLILILGSGVGMPMTVKSVKVWQSSSTQNLVM